MAIKKKTVHYRVDGCACLQGFVNIGDCDDDNIYDAEGAPVPGAVITPAGDCPQEVVIVCGNEEPPEPPEDLVLTGKDCEGNDVEVTGPPGTVISVVQAPETVFKVVLCANPRDTEKVVLCDKNNDHKVAVISDLTDPAAPIVTFWDLSTGAAWEGYVEDLEACSGASLESDPVEMCDGGTEFLRWVVKDDGEPTGQKFDTTLAGAVYTVTDEDGVKLGKCVADTEQSVSSVTADKIGDLLPGTSFAVYKDPCCALKLITSIGDIIIPKTADTYGTQIFKTPFTITAVEVVAGTCDPSGVTIISNLSS